MPRWQHSSMKCARLQRRLGEQDAVVGEDRHRVAVQVREAGHQRGAVVGLNSSSSRAVDDARDDLAHVVGLARVGGDHAVDLLGGIERLARLAHVQARRACVQFRLRDDSPHDGERVRVVQREWSATPETRVCTSAPPSSSALTTSPVAAFTSGGPPRKIVPWPLTMIDSSRHRRHVGAARGARAHHARRSAGCPRADMLAWL